MIICKKTKYWIVGKARPQETGPDRDKKRWTREGSILVNLNGAKNLKTLRTGLPTLRPA